MEQYRMRDALSLKEQMNNAKNNFEAINEQRLEEYSENLDREVDEIIEESSTEVGIDMDNDILGDLGVAEEVSVGEETIEENKEEEIMDKSERKYKVVTLCGSTSFKNVFIEAWKRLTLEGNVVFMIAPFWREDHDGQREIAPEVKEMFFNMHCQKILMSDAIMVINAGGYIGETTQKEIDFAKKHNIEVLYWEQVSFPGDLNTKEA